MIMSEEQNLKIQLQTSIATVLTLNEAVERGEIKRNAVLPSINYHTARQMILEQLIESEQRNAVASNGNGKV